jgi:hypothetical protein
MFALFFQKLCERRHSPKKFSLRLVIGGVCQQGDFAQPWLPIGSLSRNRPQSCKLPPMRQLHVMHHAGVMPLTVAAAYCDLLPQVRQSNVAAVVFNQSLLSVWASSPALGAGQMHHIGGVVVEFEGTGHSLRYHFPGPAKCANLRGANTGGLP